MPIIQQHENVVWSKQKRKYYESKGYHYTFNGDVFQVKVEDLPVSYTGEVECQCDYCGKPFKAKYKNICYRIGRITCSEACTREKIKETNLIKRGVEHHWQDPECEEKRKQTWLSRYGVDHIGKSKEAHEKANYNRVMNDHMKVSTPELYYCNLLDQYCKCIHPYPIFGKIFDAAILDKKIDFEYDGGFHCKFLDPKLDNDRDDFVIENGWKVIRFLSPRDVLMDSNDFFMVMDECMKQLDNSNLIRFHVDTHTFL